MRNAWWQKLVIALLLLCAYCVLPAAQVGAVSGLTVSPPLKEISLSPGLIKTSFDVTLTNNTATALNTSYQLVDLKALAEYGGNSLGQAGLPDQYNLANWMSLAGPSSQNIASGATATIKIAIDNRSDLKPGGHYGAILINVSGDKTQAKSVSLSQQVVSLVFVKKVGGDVAGLDLDVLKPNTSTDVPASAELQFRASGNVHVVPRGYVQVTDPKGKLLAKGIINEDSSIVLPGASRKFTVILRPVAESHVTGQYTVTAYYRYDGQSNFSSQSTYFTRSISITRVILPVLIGVFVISVLVMGWRKRAILKNVVKRRKL